MHRDPRKRPNSAREAEHQANMAKKRKEDQLEKHQAQMRMEELATQTMASWTRLRSGHDVDVVKLVNKTRILTHNKHKCSQIVQGFLDNDDDVIQLAEHDNRLLSEILTRRSVFRKTAEYAASWEKFETLHHCCSGVAFELVIEMDLETQKCAKNISPKKIVKRDNNRDLSTVLGLLELALGETANPNTSFSCYEWYLRNVDTVVWTQANLEHLLNGISFFGNAVDILGCGSLQEYFFQCPITFEAYSRICCKLQDVQKNTKSLEDPLDEDYRKCYRALVTTDAERSGPDMRTCFVWNRLSANDTQDLPDLRGFPDPVPGMSFTEFFKTVPVNYNTYQEIADNADYRGLALEDYRKYQMDTIVRSRQLYRDLPVYSPSLEFRPAIMYDLYNDDIVKLNQPRTVHSFFGQHTSHQTYTCHQWYTDGTDKLEPTVANLERLGVGIGFVGNILDIIGCGSRKAYFFDIPVTFANYVSIMAACVVFPKRKLSGDGTI